MSIDVIRPGLLTSIQDPGRRGWRRFGIVVGGAMDPLALQVANELVGNDPADAALEMTLVGPTLRLPSDTVVAICGGDLGPCVEDVQVPLWRPVWIRGGSVLRLGTAVAGCRAVLAIAGGLDVPEILGSRSTCFQARFGGFQGRALRSGDSLSTRPKSRRAARVERLLAQQAGSHPIAPARWWAGKTLANYADAPTIRVCPGRQFEAFTQSERDTFFSSPYEITADSDRTGFRLAGPPLGNNSSRTELLSEAMLPGTIQVPPNGQPIVLMADCPVTGGYPKIAQVAAVDLPVLAQLRPGGKIRFRQITVSEAERLYRQREVEWNRLRWSLTMQLEVSEQIR